MFLIPSTYLPPLPLFARIFGAKGRVRVEWCANYVKQTYQNRALIASPQGPLALTVPVVRSGNHTPFRDVAISPHGGWARQHWQALRTAYDGTPFFAYLEPELQSVYDNPPRLLSDFNERLTAILCDFIGINYRPEYTPHYAASPPAGTADCRPLAEPRLLKADTGFLDVRYWQPFHSHQGFLPRLSAIDLICSLGPEARLVLREALPSESDRHTNALPTKGDATIWI